MTNIYLGLDVGGTHVRIVAYDESIHKISPVQKVAFKKSGNSEREVNQNLSDLIVSVLGERSLENKALKGIGLSLAALFDRRNGDITFWPNNQIWNRFPLKSHLAGQFNVPVVMEDDANSAALGEHLAGAGQGYSNLAYVTVSTGIGCGLILNNSIYVGANGWAGEIGHIKIIEGGPDCSCGMRGCLQSVASGPAILKRFIGMKGFERHQAVKAYDLKDVSGLAMNEDKEAQAVFSEAGVFIGKMIANLVMILDIPLIILGGGVTSAGEILFKPVQETVNAYLAGFSREIEIKKAQLGESSGAIGALSLIYQYLNDGKTILI